MIHDDRVAAGKELVAYTDTLDEIARITQGIRKANEAMSYVIPRCAICDNADCEECCIADNTPIVQVGTTHGTVARLTNSEMATMLPLCNKLLAKRITDGITRLHELVAMLEDREREG